MDSLPILTELGVVLATAAVMLLATRPFGVPPILAYMVGGLLVGPIGGWISVGEAIHLFSELGIALLLFLIGLELSVARIRSVGGRALSAGLIQVAVTAGIGYGLGRVLGFSVGDSWMIGLATAFSSTVVVVKLLDQTGDVSALHGRLAIGILLVQDLIIAAALTVLAGLSSGTDTSSLTSLAAGLLRPASGIVVLGLAAWLGLRFLLPPLLGWLARWGESSLIVSLTWCFGFILLAEFFHVSVELGAFVAGVGLAQLPYAHDLVRRVHPLVDFFLAVFFVALGIGMDLSAIPRLWVAALVLSVFVMTVKPALIAILTRGAGGRRTGLLTGLTLGQISEFSFILIGIAMAGGLIDDPDLVPLVGLVGLFTIGVSAVVVPNGRRILDRFGVERERGEGEGRPSEGESPLSGHIIIVGMNTLGRALARRFHERGENVIAIDTDPSKLRGLPVRTLFGDADSPAVLADAGLSGAKLLVSALQIEDVNALLTFRCRNAGVPSSIHAFDTSVTEELLSLGADNLMISKVDGIGLVRDELVRLGVLR